MNINDVDQIKDMARCCHTKMSVRLNLSECKRLCDQLGMVINSFHNVILNPMNEEGQTIAEMIGYGDRIASIMSDLTLRLLK